MWTLIGLAHAADKKERLDAVLARALELFDLTAADPRWRAIFSCSRTLHDERIPEPSGTCRP